MIKYRDAYNLAIQYLKTNKSEHISLLVKQYQYGIQVKQELKAIMQEIYPNIEIY